MCLNNNCHVISSETVYKTKNECLLVTDQENKKNKSKFDIFESRCIGVTNNFI
jgi:NADH:ubiquinone oxidoreductase subunit E